MTMAEMVPRTLTPEMAAAASTLVKIAHPGDTSLSRACDRAQERLFAQPWAVRSGILEIASLSNPGDIRATDGVICTCPTNRGVCYHIAGWLILSSLSAAGIAPQAPLPLPCLIDEDELPAESFLDGPFDAFEDDSLTGSGDEGREWYSDEGGGDFEEVDSLEPERAPVQPWRIQPAITNEPQPGSEFARLTADLDRMFAA